MGQVSGVEKKTAATAELIYWYRGINAFEMTAEQQVGLHANLSRLKAQQRIDEGRFDGMEHQDIYDLYLTAFGDTQLATKARTQFLEAFVRDQCNAAT